MIVAQFEPRFDSWREEARKLLRDGVPPDKIQWQAPDTSLTLFQDLRDFAVPNAPVSPRVPPKFLEDARLASLANEPARWDLLYRILYRINHGEAQLLEDVVDRDVLRLHHLVKSVRRDLHKMHAFIRFKEVQIDGRLRYVAWHRPEHPCLREGANFFVRRFGDREWSIFTPDESAHWDRNQLTFGDGIAQHEFQFTDAFDELWKTYYASIFNPARIKIKAMKAEMSPKYWESLPEVALIPKLIRDAPERLARMAQHQNSQAEVRPAASLNDLRAAAASCKACPLFTDATQTVFGEGPEDAAMMIVGEQPGDHEDLEGRVFVGPAGEILNEALHGAGVRREDVYVTNAVKHFKWKAGDENAAGGKRRLHQKPSGRELHACRPWLQAEIQHVKPEVILLLGTTAATSVLGRLPKITQERGQVISDTASGAKVVISWHPSAILRSPHPEDAAQKKAELIEDLSLCKQLILGTK